MIQEATDAFAVIAPFYDLDFQDREDDILMYRELARRRGGGVPATVLELGCGTGRVAAPLAQSGLEVVGVDVRPAMLELARERRDVLPLTLLQGDLRTLHLGRRAPLLLLPLRRLPPLPHQRPRLHQLPPLLRQRRRRRQRLRRGSTLRSWKNS